jgi:hypothetical protein
METESTPSERDPAHEMTREEWEAANGQVDPFRFLTAAQLHALLDLELDDADLLALLHSGLSVAEILETQTRVAA